MFNKCYQFFIFFIVFLTSLFAANDGIVSGIVTNSSLQPLQNALVSVYKNLQLVGSTTTDPNGFYSITIAANKYYTISASLANYQTQSQSLVIKKNETTTANFSLLPSPGFLNVKTFAAGSALDGVLVSVIQNNVVIVSGSTLSGEITFTTLAPGSYTVKGEKANYATVTEQVIISSNVLTQISLTLNQILGQLNGNVKGNSVDIQGALISVVFNGTTIATALSDLSGNYGPIDLSPNTYNLYASADGYHTALQGVTITSNTLTAANFNLTSLQGTLNGKLTSPQGENLAGAVIEIIKNNIVISSTTTDYYGNYEITGIFPGFYTIHAHDPGYQSQVLGANISDNQTTTLNITLEPDSVSLSGTVSSSGFPIPSATVEVNLNNIVLFSTLTNTQGQYLINGISPGSYVLHAHATNYTSAVTPFDIVSGSNSANFVLTSSAAASLIGTVKDSSLNSLSGAIIELNGNNQILFSTLTNTNGQYTFPNIPPASYTVHCHKTPFQTSIRAQSVVGVSVADFILEPFPSSVRGSVFEYGANSSVPGAFMSLYLDGVFIASVVSSDQGFYQIGGLPSGNYQMITLCNNYSNVTNNFFLGNFENLELNIVLSSLSSPTNGKATLSLNSYALQTQQVYRLSWEKPGDSAVTGYNIYRNHTKIITLPSANTTSFQDKTPPNSVVYFYKIVSINSQGQEIGSLYVFP